MALGRASLKNIKTFYINLDKSVDRRERFQHNYGFSQPITRFPAVYASEIYKDNKHKHHKEFMKKISLLTQARIQLAKRHAHEEIDAIGAIGASLSHYYLWAHLADVREKDDYKKFVSEANGKYVDTAFDDIGDRPDEMFLIFEDDVYLDPYTGGKLVRFLDPYFNKLQREYKDWDVWVLGSYNLVMDNHNKKNENYQRKTEFNNVFLSCDRIVNDCTNDFCDLLHFFQMHAYIVKRSALKKIFDFGNFFPIEAHVDAWFSMLSQQKVIKVVTTKDILIYQNGYSTIGHGPPIVKERIQSAQNTTIVTVSNSTVGVSVGVVLLVLLVVLGVFFWRRYRR
jgi:GR25 family glycosyltransferase involved in LPS biosynthesis